MAGSIGPDKIQFPQLSSEPTGASGDGYYNSTTDSFRLNSGGTWVTIANSYDGSTQATPAPSGTYLYEQLGITTDGVYWIKPEGYSGSALQCRVVFNGAATSYGRGMTLIGSYASLSGFRQDQNTSGRNVSYINSTINPLATQHNSNGPSIYPKDFVNAMVNQRYSNHTIGGFTSSNSTGTAWFQYRQKSAPTYGNIGSSSFDGWHYMYATGDANNNCDMRYVTVGGNPTPSQQMSQSYTWPAYSNFGGGRTGASGNNTYHYMPDDYTAGYEWWFRENADDSNHQSASRAGNDLAFVW